MLTSEEKGTGSVKDICTSCGYPFSDSPGNESPNECSHPDWHDK